MSFASVLANPSRPMSRLVPSSASAGGRADFNSQYTYNRMAILPYLDYSVSDGAKLRLGSG